jgi:hypothetical protein
VSSAATDTSALRAPGRAALDRAIRFNLIVIAVTMGAVAGALLWLATAILLLRGGEHVGVHLGLLGVFLPGYSVTWPGAWVGLFWGFVAGAASGAILYSTYAKGLRSGLNQIFEPERRIGIRPPVMRISGPGLGLGLGALAAIQLFLATNWLVVRGTAPYSENAALLGQYLYGYTVSFVGSLIGCVQVFAMAFLASVFIAVVYNAIAARRANP